jgi:hypothetical protein
MFSYQLRYKLALKGCATTIITVLLSSTIARAKNEERDGEKT